MNFKDYFLQEVKKSDLENVDLSRDLHFDNLFGSKLRIVVPLDTEEELNNLVKSLQELGYSVDHEDLINKKVAYKTIKEIKPKEDGTFNFSHKQRPEKIGGILQNAIKKHPENSKVYRELLDWWQKNSDKLKNNNDGVSIVVSRSPIDIVRMSDHDGISSCHSPNNSYFKCAKQEARTGGAVAYVVRNADLKHVNLQDPEIFEDRQRKVVGIVPLERLRLRRFNKDHIDLLVPELRTYGGDHIGFYNAVKDWAAHSQKEEISQIKPEEDFDDFELKGGSYQDSKASEVWNKFFSTSVGGGKDSVDREEEGVDGMDADELYDAAERQIEEHSKKWKHFSVHHDIYESDEVYLDYSAYSSFEIPVKLTTEKFAKIKEWRDKMKVEELIRRNIDIYTVDNIDWDFNASKQSYVVNFTVHEEDGHGEPLDRLEHFLDYIDDVDRNFQTHTQKVYSVLISEGYIRKPTENITFKNFDVDFDEDEGDVTIRSKPEKIGYLKDYPLANGPNEKPLIRDYDGKLFLDNLRDKLLQKNYPMGDMLNVLPFIKKERDIEIYTIKTSTYGYKGEFGVEPHGAISGYVYFEFTSSFNMLDEGKSKTIARVKQLDNNWDFYVRRLSQIFDLTVKGEIEKRNKMFEKLPRITKPKPEYVQKTFKDFFQDEKI